MNSTDFTGVGENSLLFGRGRSRETNWDLRIRQNSTPPRLEYPFKRSVSSPAKSSRKQVDDDRLVRSHSVAPNRTFSEKARSKFLHFPIVVPKNSRKAVPETIDPIWERFRLPAKIPFKLREKRFSSAPPAIKYNAFFSNLLSSPQLRSLKAAYKESFFKIRKVNREGYPPLRDQTPEEVFAYAAATPKGLKPMYHPIAGYVLDQSPKDAAEERIQEESLKILLRKSPAIVQRRVEQELFDHLQTDPENAGYKFLRLQNIGAMGNPDTALINLAKEVGRNSENVDAFKMVRSLQRSGVELHNPDRPSFVSTLREMPHAEIYYDEQGKQHHKVIKRPRNVAPSFLSAPLTGLACPISL